ncbi:hypothetical protein ACFL3C_02885 [Patescibacteria group bacterium]
MEHKYKKTLLFSFLTGLVLGSVALATPALAATPGDLVNTESFFIIDDGDGTTDLQLQFGDTLAKVLSYDITNSRFNFDDNVYVEGDASLEGNLLLDADDTAGDVTIQFGTTLAEVIQWDSGNSRFNISDNTYVDGTLEVNGDVYFNQNEAIDMVFHSGTAFPSTPVEGQTFYRSDLNSFYIYDGSSWVAMADAAGADVIFLAPLYPHTTYYADGGSNTGRLTYYYDNTNVENAYRWTTSKAAAQDYDTVVRIQLPDNFSSWDSTTPIEFKYRTDTTSTAQNKLDLTMFDTADASVTLSNNTNLASSGAGTWETSTNMGITGGTWTAGSWVTINIKTTATSAGGAEAGSLVLNYNI